LHVPLLTGRGGKKKKKIQPRGKGRKKNDWGRSFLPSTERKRTFQQRKGKGVISLRKKKKRDVSLGKRRMHGKNFLRLRNE